MTVSVGFVKIILSDVYLKYKHLHALPLCDNHKGLVKTIC